jgi:hypothetical protein
MCRLHGRSGLPDDLDVAVLGEQLGDATTNHLVVIEKEDSYHPLFLLHPGPLARLPTALPPGIS